MCIRPVNTCRPRRRACRASKGPGGGAGAGRAAPDRGFTLLEILVAISIFAVLMTTLYASFNAVTNRNQAIEEGRGLYEMARSCLERIRTDLSAIYVELPPLYTPPDFDDPADPYRFVGQEEIVGAESFSRLRFASQAHLPMGGETETGIAEIVYYVEPVDRFDSAYVLRRSDTAYPYDMEEFAMDEATDPIVCKGVESFQLSFIDQEGEARTDWDSEEGILEYATPRAVKIEITVSDEASSHAFSTTVPLPVYRKPLEGEREAS